MPPKLRRNGYSLTEVMVVLAVGAVMLGLAASHSMVPRDHLAPETAARQFQGMLREARLLAMENRAPVRVVFIPLSLSGGLPEAPAVPDGDMEEEDPWVECRMFQFTIPPAATREVVWRLPGDQNAVRGGDALERIPVAAPGLPAPLVGQWKRVPRKALYFASTLDRRVMVDSELFERFADQKPEDFHAENGWRPPSRWQRGGMDAWNGWCQSSPFPEHYHLTPLPDGPPLVEKPLAAQEQIFDPQRRQWRPASDYWGSGVDIVQFDADIENDATVGAIHHHLPYIEFDAHGRMQARWSEGFEIRFGLEGRPGPAAVVRLGVVGSGVSVTWVMP